MPHLTQSIQVRAIDPKGRGLGHIPVSNGERVVLTDGSGAARLPLHPARHTHVFVTVPRGFEADDGCWRSLDRCRRDGASFRLRRVRREADTVRFAAVTDLHYGHLPPAGPAAARLIRRDLRRLVAMVPQARFIIAAGDLSDHGRPAELSCARRLFDECDVPVHAAFGNHDRTSGSPGDDRARLAAYLDAFGPLWYSFERGGFHFTVYVNHDGFVPPCMLEAKRRWLKADLGSARRRGLERIVVAHFPPTMIEAHRLARRGVRLMLCGHFHSHRTYRLGPLRVLNFPSMMRGGIDMMPRGFLELTATPGRDVSYRYRPLGPIFDGLARRSARRRIVWSRKLPGTIHRATPVMDDAGRLFVTSSEDLHGRGAQITCLDATRGRVRWRRTHDESIRCGVALTGDRLLSVTQTGTLVCLDADGGRRLWQRRLAQWPDRWINAPPAVAGNLVIAGHARGGLEAFEITRGTRRWHRGADQAPFTNSNGDMWPNHFAPVVGGHLLIGHRRTLSRLDPRTGEDLWAHDTNYGWYLPAPLVRDGGVWVPNGQPGDRLVRLRLSDGRVERRIRASGVPVNWEIAGDRLYLVVLDRWIGGQGRLQCRSATTGRLFWDRPLGGDPAHAYAYYASDGPPSQAPPRIVGDRLHLACTDGSVRCFDTSSGAPRGRIDLASPLFTAPLITGDRMWAALWSGEIVCVRL